MSILRAVIPLLALAFAALPARAEKAFTIGGDNYVSGASPTLSEPSPRDAFATGANVAIKGKVDKDAHAWGFNVDVDAPIGADLYAAGFSVTVEQPVGEDLNAAGFSVDIRQAAAIGGNARAAGGAVTIDAPISGSLVAKAGTLKLNAPVKGDVAITAGRIEFGSAARIGGSLTYSAPKAVDIPASVISADRVHFEKIERGPGFRQIEREARRSMPHFWPSAFGIVFGFVTTIIFLIIVAAVLLAVAPATVERLRQETITRPWTSLVFGFLGLATLVGLVPVSAVTLIGIPFVPIVIFAIVIFWIAAYLLGAYALSWRVATAFRPFDTTMVNRLIVIGVGIVVLAVLNFIPFLGWLINLAVVFLGLGAIAAHGAAGLLARRGGAEVTSSEAADPSI